LGQEYTSPSWLAFRLTLCSEQSAIPWSKDGFAVPREKSEQDVRDVVEGVRNSAKRAVEAGVDVIEIHGRYLVPESDLEPAERSVPIYSASAAFTNTTLHLIKISTN
jgi:hypothetical protein